jgi:hypothetical protein
MGFRIQKRINLGKGIGVNVSKSGASPSLRTKYGSVSSKGFSIRTGIPGVSYRGGKNDKAAGVMIVIGLIVALIKVIPFLINMLRNKRRSSLQERKQ